jgi:hypothetical protein
MDPGGGNCPPGFLKIVFLDNLSLPENFFGPLNCLIILIEK